MRDPIERLRDMLDAIERIDRYAASGKGAFEQDELIQSWFLRNLQILGEAARMLPADLRHSEPDVPWAKIIGMRNILVHDYFGIDTDTVWNAVERDLGPLKASIVRILARTSPE